MVIKPEAIPEFSGDLGAVESNAAALKSAGGTFRTTGQDVHSTWQGLSAFYEAPEAARLFGATVQVQTQSDAIAGDIEEVGAALAQYAATVRPIANRLTQLRGEAGSFVAGLQGDDDWRADGDKVNRNNELISQVDTQVAALMAAERETANRINRLYGGTQWTVNDGSQNPNAYGFDAGQLPGDADRPWGSSEEKDEPWYVDTWNWVCSENKGFWVDGLWGDVTGLVGLVNIFDWDTFTASWGGLWTLTGGLVFDTENSLKAWKEFGKSLLAWDEWSKDPARALGNVLYNVVTIPLAAAKVGTVGKGGKGAAAAADAGKAADAARAADAAGEAGKAADAGRLGADLGRVADVGRVDQLPTVGDLARQIDAALGDAIKADPNLELALRQADDIAASADRASRPDDLVGRGGDQPGARVEEPVLVGAGRGGGVDAPPSTGRGGGGSDLPPSTGRGGGPDLPPSTGRGGGGAFDDVGSTAGRGADDATGLGRAGDDVGQGAGDVGRGADEAAEAGRGPEGAGGRDGDSGGSGGGADDAGRADDAAGPPRYGDDDLEPTGLRDKTYGQELKIGPDGNLHFPGDRADTWRDEYGKLHDQATGDYVKQDNAPLTGELAVRAEPDLSTVDRHTPDETGPGTVRDAVVERDRIVQQRTDLWNETLQPIANKLREHDIVVNEASLSPKKIDSLLAKSEDILSPRELLDLEDAGRQYNRWAVELRDASERLGTAGGDFVAGKDFPGARTVTEGEGLRGTRDNLDRILYDDTGSGRIIAIEEKGAGSGLGSRLVDDPANPTGPRIRVEQMSTEYLRHMLQHDNKLADVLSKDPQLRARFQGILDGTDPGQLQYRLVQTSDKGVVTVTDYLVDGGRLGRGTIIVAGTR